MEQASPYVIRPLVPDAIYTDRQDFIDYFYDYGLAAIRRRAMSSVLLGKRRMGKTEIFKRAINRLFYEQDHTDPKAAVPVFYSFRETAIDRWEFAIEYVENFLRWHAAFRLRDPNLLEESGLRRDNIIDFFQANVPLTDRLSGACRVLESLRNHAVTIPEATALTLPRRVSDRDDSTIVMFLDEFQNTRLPQDNFDLVGFLQEAVESPTCPHFVTGSAMTILSREILGRGALFGRFRSQPIEPMSEYWGAELARRTARFYEVRVSELMAPVLAERCGGNPFYITAVIQQAAEQNSAIEDEDAINTLLAVDLSSGFIWAELNDQVGRWIERINEYGITKWVLYLSALEDGERIEPEHIQQQLYDKDRQQVDLATIRDVLIRLSRGDLLEYMELGGWFRKVDDPILLEFLKVWGSIDVAGRSASRVRDELAERYETLQRRFHEYKGYLGEVYMSQILWSGARATFPGALFHRDEDITMPRQFSYIHHRARFGSGEGKEVDLFGAAGSQIWVCQSKWLTREKVGVRTLEELLDQGELAKASRKHLRIMRLWLFAYNGVTAEAEAFARQHDILWSSKTDVNALLRLLGLRELPELSSP